MRAMVLTGRAFRHLATCALLGGVVVAAGCGAETPTAPTGQAASQLPPGASKQAENAANKAGVGESGRSRLMK